MDEHTQKVLMSALGSVMLSDKCASAPETINESWMRCEGHPPGCRLLCQVRLPDLENTTHTFGGQEIS